MRKYILEGVDFAYEVIYEVASVVRVRAWLMNPSVAFYIELPSMGR